MTDIVWLPLELALAAHEQAIANSGGQGGVRDEGLLQSALARPQNLAAYGEPNLAELAAAYAYGIVRNHPSIDGNKRAALLAAYVFLELNDHTMTAPEVDAVFVFRDLAASEIDEATLAHWIAANMAPLDEPPS
ncbi:MAG: type II toxin-antitoxin system death-on-curing family toxin [Alphaproteobacteria bacterium]|jgi:death-on-curing protein|nr:type II toxin-antitoxin system death-on-curing family toxin [Rhodospirillaceae bacterium]MDP6406316.1 type II toxin-antitoxin system death-on-curing family toxin [Alphaproteobacteria bacterium]MDP6624036.1 type II toxin-antitoxin system death-on-curing family toxin [Alphaproteobacteria bacterium]|tara:strand:+ start:622 stop:1023 length:402 start_codon:yes stop_codon:yes gene_type:complete